MPNAYMVRKLQHTHRSAGLPEGHWMVDDLEAHLNEHALEGWRLAHVEHDFVVLQRYVPTDEERAEFERLKAQVNEDGEVIITAPGQELPMTERAKLSEEFFKEPVNSDKVQATLDKINSPEAAALEARIEDDEVDELERELIPVEDETPSVANDDEVFSTTNASIRRAVEEDTGMSN